MKAKYLVLSIKNLRAMLQIAEAISKKHGPSFSDTDCMIYGLEALTGTCSGQLSLESVRACASQKHYNPTNVRNASDPLMPYHGDFTTTE